MKKFDQMGFIEKMISFSPRQLEGEIRTGEYIKSILSDYGTPFRLQNFTTYIPSVAESKLEADGKNIRCESCSFKSGKINGKSQILNSLMSSQILQNHPNLNFNPLCKAISQSNFYFAPSLAIASGDILKIIKAKEVKGIINIEKIRHETFNILAGNTINPEFICLTHYDSIKKGATDNASGVAVCLELLLSEEKIAEKGLFVISANEELSFDKPVYWGHGYREFEKSYEDILSKTKKIIVVDSVGNGKPVLVKEKGVIKLAFPIKNLNNWKKKITLLAGDMNKLMEVYNSDNDDLAQLSEKNLNLTTEALRKIIKTI